MTEWTGYEDRECGDHRTTGKRAWCLDCTEWCYDTIPCRGCELPVLRARISHLESEIEGLRGERDRLARRIHDWENEDGEFIKCGATSDHLFCVFHCYEPEGHTGPHHGDAAGVIFADDSGKPHGVVANPPIDRLAAAERQNEVLRAALTEIAKRDGKEGWQRSAIASAALEEK